MLIISPLITPVVARKFKDNAEVFLATTFGDVLHLLKANLQPQKVYLYPFLLAGDDFWCRDIHWGGTTEKELRRKGFTDITVIMDGDHHAEPFEPMRFIGDAERCYCSYHTPKDIEKFIQCLIDGTKPGDFESKAYSDDCFKLNSPFWINRVAEISVSFSLYNRIPPHKVGIVDGKEYFFLRYEEGFIVGKDGTQECRFKLHEWRALCS